MMIALVVPAVLIAIVDSTRSAPDHSAGGEMLHPAFGQLSSNSTTGELCAAFDNAGEYFRTQNSVSGSAGLSSIADYVAVADRYPAESIQWGARNIRSAVSSGIVEIDTWYPNTRDVRVVCR